MSQAAIIWSLPLIIVARFGCGGRDVSNWLEQATVVKPLHPFEGHQLDGLQ